MLTCTTGSLDGLPAPARAASVRSAAAWLDRAGAAAAPNTDVDAGNKAPLDDCAGTAVSGGSAAMRVCRGRTGSGANTSAGRSSADDATGRSMTGDGVGVAAIGAGCTAVRGVLAAARAAGGAITGPTSGATRDASVGAVTDACGERIGAMVGATGAADTVS